MKRNIKMKPITYKMYYIKNLCIISTKILILVCKWLIIRKKRSFIAYVYSKYQHVPIYSY